MVVDCNTHGSATGLAVLAHESRQYINGQPRRPSVGERNEDNFVAAERLAVPGAVLSDEHAVLEFTGQGGLISGAQSQ